MNGAAFIARFLKDKGVEHVFGYPGGAIINVINAIAEGGIQYVQNYHEQASALCADAYARIRPGAGVAVATSGPGATNLVTGIANAQYDSIPCLFITGQERTFNLRPNENIRQNGFQDMDITEVVRPITKYAAIVKDPLRLGYELEKAWHIATTGRKGAVLVDIPSDIQVAEVDPTAMAVFSPEAEAPQASAQVAEFVAQIMASKRPTILVGGGIRMAGAEEALRGFLAKLSVPVVATLRGLDSHEDIVAFSGTYGNLSANLAVANADLLVVLGARLSLMQVGKFKDKYTQGKVVHVDIDPYEFGRALPEALSIQADLKAFLTAAASDPGLRPVAEHGAWKAQVQAWGERYGMNAAINKQGLDPVRVIRSLSASFAPDAVICSDVGQNQMWVAQALRLLRGQRLLNSGGHGSMGYSLPAAIGAQFAAPQRQAVAFMGDGGFQINLQELQLVSQRRLNVKCVVLNNQTLGMIKDLQRYFKMDFHGSDARYYRCPDLKLMAQAYGLRYHRIDDEASLAAAAQAFADGEPWLIEVALSEDSVLFNIYTDQKILEETRLGA